MKNNELKMTNSDISKLSFNNKTSAKMSLIFLVVGLLLLYSTWNKNSYFLKFGFGLFSLIGFTGLLNLFFGQNKKKDLNEKIKIVFETRITNKKKVTTNNSDTDFNTYKTKYKLIFEKSKSYEVSKSDFNKVSIGDEVRIEYAKYSKWILNITSKNFNIENRSYLQKF